MTPTMTPERKQELMASSLAFCPYPADEVDSEDFYSHVTHRKIQPLTHGELRELLTEPVCECAVRYQFPFCPLCGGKVQVTR